MIKILEKKYIKTIRKLQKYSILEKNTWEKYEVTKNIHIIDFPLTRQSTNYTCGANVVQSILYYYWENIREDILEKELWTDPEKWTPIKNIKRFFKDKWFLINMWKMTINDLKNYIDNNIPVIILIQAWKDDFNKTDYKNIWEDWHYVLAIWYDDTSIIFNDPSILHKWYITYKELYNRWHDTDEKKRYINWWMAVYWKKVMYSSQIIQEIL